MGPSPGDRIHLPCPPIVGRNCGIDARLTRDETRFDPHRERRLVPRRERIGQASRANLTHLEARALVLRREVSAAALGATMVLEAVMACMVFV